MRRQWDGDELMTPFYSHTHTATWRRKQRAEPRRGAPPYLPAPCPPQPSSRTPSPPPLLPGACPPVPSPLLIWTRRPRLPPCGPSRYCSSRPFSQGPWSPRPLLPSKLGRGVTSWSQAGKPFSKPSKTGRHSRRPASNRSHGSRSFWLVPGQR